MAVNIDTRESIDIETNGGTVTLDLHGRSVLSIHVRGDGAADYALDVRGEDDETWMQGAYSFTGATNYDEMVRTGVKHVRLRCTSGTATAGQSADVLLSASDS